jgi:hypothetical protein
LAYFLIGFSNPLIKEFIDLKKGSKDDKIVQRYLQKNISVLSRSGYVD